MSAPRLAADDPLAVAVTTAVRNGDVAGLRALLDDHDHLARVWITSRRCSGGSEARSLLHVVTDWPGGQPNGAALVRLLVACGADVNAAFRGEHRETPLHWAASNDDVGVIDALIDARADINAPGAVIAGGTPLDDAVAFGQWHAARRLVERGASTAVWHAAALGLLDLVSSHFTGDRLPGAHRWGADRDRAPGDLDVSLWCACHGGQLATAQYLVEHGADPSWVAPWDDTTPFDAAARADARTVTAWLTDIGARPASNPKQR